MFFIMGQKSCGFHLFTKDLGGALLFLPQSISSIKLMLGSLFIFSNRPVSQSR